MLRDALNGIKQLPQPQDKPFLHRKANSFGWPPSSPSQCSCCQKYTHKQQFSICLDKEELFYLGPGLSGYLWLLGWSVVIGIFLGGLGLALSLINYFNNGCNQTLCTNGLSYRLSCLNSFDTLWSVDLLLYSTLLVTLISLFVVTYWGLAINSLKQRYSQKGLYPDNHGCLLTLPNSQLSESFLTDQIDLWWKQELQLDPETIIKICPELKERQNYQFTSQESDQVNLPRLQTSHTPSFIVEKVIFSFNSTCFQTCKQQLKTFAQYLQGSNMDREEANRLLALQRKRKVEHQISKNNFCLIIFKNSAYANHFYIRNNPGILQKVFCSTTQNTFTINKEEVTITRDHLPNEIYWDKMDMTQKQQFYKRVRGFLWIGVGMTITVGIWLGISFLHQHLVNINHTVLDYYPFLLSIGAYLWVIILGKITQCVVQSQHSIHYQQKSASYLSKQFILEVTTFIIAPLLAYYLVDSSLLWSKHFFPIILFQATIYMTIGLVSPYLAPKALLSHFYYLFPRRIEYMSQSQLKQKVQKPEMGFENIVLQLVTSVYLTVFVLPWWPLFGTVFLAWTLLNMFLIRANIAYYWKQQQSHGLAVVLWAVTLIQLSPLVFNFSSILVELLAQQQGLSTFQPFPLTTAILSAILPLFPLFRFSDFSQATIYSSDQDYKEQKSKCLKKYQELNEAYQFIHEQGAKPVESDRIKVDEEMNTMSKTLSLSLKQQLMGRQTAILNSLKHPQEEGNDQINHIYFQYEQKVFMRSESKVVVPPLFPKLSPKKKSKIVPNIELSKLFEGNVLRKVKQQIKNKVKAEELQS